jgi:hypothetical protein
MALTLRTVLLILAIVCFGAAAVNVQTARVNLTALGLFLMAIALTVTA